MGNRLRAVICGRSEGLASLGAALEARRCDVVWAVSLADVEPLEPNAFDLVFVDANSERANVCSAFLGSGASPRPFLVGMVPSYTTLVVDEVLALGVDDVLALADLPRLGPILRHAARFRQTDRDSTGAPVDVLGQVSDFVLQIDRNAIITFLNRDGPVRTVSETIGSSVYDHLPEEWQANFRTAFEAALATREPKSYETASHGRKFRVRIMPGLCDGEVRGATLLATDVTELTSLVGKLRESETHAEAILDALPDLVVRVHQDGTLLDVHVPPRAANGVYPPEVAPGRPLAELVSPVVAEKLFKAIRRAITTSALEVETYSVGEGADRRDFEARIVGNGASQAVVVIRNVTEQNRSRERSTITERLASLGTMAAGVAHELNSPLTFVMLGLEWIGRQITAIEPGRAVLPETHRSMSERLREVTDGARRIQRIVRDLKGFTRSEDSRANLVDVPSAIDGALSLASAELRYRARIEKTYEPIPPILGNHARLGQVVLNLLVNAAHALHEEKAVENVVSVWTGIAADGRVEIRVSDNGHGIPPNDLAHLFEPFFTTKPVGQGTGLGLWVCHEIVTELGGEILVESTLGKGSTFRVLLPVADHRGLLPPPSSRASVPPPTARILVIDDEPNLATTLARLLEGHKVEVAVGGQAALDVFATDSDFDLVLCDLMMPRKSGMDVYAEVEKTRPYLASRFVFMTGGAFTPRAKAFLAEVGLPHLDKPFRLEAVIDVLKKKREK